MSFVFFPGIFIFLLIMILMVIFIVYVIRKGKKLFRRIDSLEKAVYDQANLSSNTKYGEPHPDQAVLDKPAEQGKPH